VLGASANLGEATTGSYHSYVVCGGREMNSALARDVLDLTRKNMEELYKEVWGWDDEAKRKELEHPHARILVAYEVSNDRVEGEAAKVQTDTHLMGFLNFRFVLDNNRPTIYIYEAQVKAEFQGRGLGMSLMMLAEELGRVANMNTSMLTALKSNDRALNFYKTKLGYHLDCSSPELHPELKGPHKYEILSKPLFP